MGLFSKIIDSNLRWGPKKNPYERRDYESVDEKSLLRLCPEKRRKNNNSGGNEFNNILKTTIYLFSSIVHFSTLIPNLKSVFWGRPKFF